MPQLWQFLNKGAKNVEILKQGQYAPIPVEKQIAIIYCGTMGLLKDVPVNKVKSLKMNILSFWNLSTEMFLIIFVTVYLMMISQMFWKKLLQDLVIKYKPLIIWIN